jgi:hypothetical protein
MHGEVCFLRRSKGPLRVRGQHRYKVPEPACSQPQVTHLLDASCLLDTAIHQEVRGKHLDHQVGHSRSKRDIAALRQNIPARRAPI